MRDPSPQLRGFMCGLVVLMALCLLATCAGCMTRIDGDGAYIGVGWKPVAEWVREKCGNDSCEVDP